MAVKTFRPITPSARYKTMADFSVLTKDPEKVYHPKKLLSSLSSSGGRNVYGRITVFQRGGGHKRQYRVIDFARTKMDISAKVQTIEYDPNRTCYIALIAYADGEKTYILAPQALKEGDSVISSEKADIQPGNSLMLMNIPVGTFIHNLEVEPGKGGKMVRSAGSAAQLMAKESDYCQVRMPSGEMRKLHSRCRASIGLLSNNDHENMKTGKAGRNRWKGIRPHVRGVAMNPIDHPMGGGEGKASGGHPQSPWGTPAKGYKTRNNKRTDMFVLKRRK